MPTQMWHLARMGNHDLAIRAHLIREISQRQPGNLIVQEWGVGDSIVDVGVIGVCHIEGIEIKSAADSVSRLRNQSISYSQMFSSCTLVTTSNHLKSSEKILPDWWAILLFDGAQIRTHRDGGLNPDANTARLLWVRELRAICRRIGIYKPALDIQRSQEIATYGRSFAKTPSKQTLIEELSRSLDRTKLNLEVCRGLRSRTEWRREDGYSMISKRQAL